MIIQVPVGTVVHKLKNEPNDTPESLELHDTPEDHKDVPDSPGEAQKLKKLKMEKNPPVQLVDVEEDGQRYLLARGGRGGFGNAVFKTGGNRSPP